MTKRQPRPNRPSAEREEMTINGDRGDSAQVGGMTPTEMLEIWGIDPNCTGPCVSKLREVFAQKCRDGLTGAHISLLPETGPDEHRAYEALQWEWAIKRGHTYPYSESPRWWHIFYWAQKFLATYRAFRDRNSKPFGMDKP